ncbi:MAG: hypothetical protein J5I65_11485 [Aridibacter famidurans]|nr:hypothetical protein [Aridibacter famidurans]
MKIEQQGPTVFRVTLHALELSALVAAARWVAEGASGEMPKEAVDQLRQVLKSYDEQTREAASA